MSDIKRMLDDLLDTQPYRKDHYDAIVEEFEHYLSTGCFHEQHDKCRLRCKFCEKACSCKCHKEVPDDTNLGG